MGSNYAAGASHGAEAEPPLWDLVIDIPQNLEIASHPKLCIYKVPITLGQTNRAAYTPQVISIGPIHQKNDNIQHPENVQKRRYLKAFCQRLSQKTEEQTKVFLRELWNTVNSSRESIGHYYSDTYDTGGNNFVNMILLDAVFILELFLRSQSQPENQNDFVVGRPSHKTAIRRDLILLENQLPYFILEELYRSAITKFEKKDNPCFLDLVCSYFSHYKPTRKQIPNLQAQNILHFTDLVRYFWTFEHPVAHRAIKSLYNVTKLKEAGLKFKPARDKHILDINFEKGEAIIPCLPRCIFPSFLRKDELRVPSFEVDDTTEDVIRNLMAFEQCHYPNEAYICNYFRLMDLLIDTAKDVDLLVEKKIIVNGLGDSAAVADLFNKLCMQIIEVKSCYYPLSIRLNNHYNSCCNRTMANLRSVYFSNLWRGTATVAAVALLLLTLIQSVCSILQVKQGNGSH